MTHTFETANADRIVGRVLGETGAHVAVAFEHTSGLMQGTVLAVRRDGSQYVVWTVLPGPDRTVIVTGGRYFDAADHRHADRWGTGTPGAYQAAHAWYEYACGRAPKPAE